MSTGSIIALVMIFFTLMAVIAPFAVLGQDARDLNDYTRDIQYEFDTVYNKPVNPRVVNVEFEKDLVYVYYICDEYIIYSIDIEVNVKEYRKVYQYEKGQFKLLETERPVVTGMEKVMKPIQEYINKY